MKDILKGLGWAIAAGAAATMLCIVVLYIIPILTIILGVN